MRRQYDSIEKARQAYIQEREAKKKAMREKHGFVIYDGIDVLEDDTLYELLRRYGDKLVLDVVAFDSEKAWLHSSKYRIIACVKLDTRKIKWCALMGDGDWECYELIRMKFIRWNLADYKLIYETCEDKLYLYEYDNGLYVVDYAKPFIKHFKEV